MSGYSLLTEEKKELSVYDSEEVIAYYVRLFSLNSDGEGWDGLSVSRVIAYYVRLFSLNFYHIR